MGSAVWALTTAGQSVWAAPGAGGNADATRFLGVGLGVLTLTLVGLVVIAALIAFNLCAVELMPGLFRKGRSILVASPVKSFFVGLVNIVLVGIIAGALGKHKATILISSLLWIALLLVVFSSRALLYQLLGVRLTGEVSDPEGLPSTRAHFWGGAIVELAALTPIIGWLAGAVATAMATGALVLGWMSRDHASAASDEPKA
jgi:hypothetical protein